MDVMFVTAKCAQFLAPNDRAAGARLAVAVKS